MARILQQKAGRVIAAADSGSAILVPGSGQATKR
jgi:hypothetical protein